MAKLDIAVTPTAGVSEVDRQGIRDVFSGGFNHDRAAEDCLQHYFETIQSVWIARDAGRIVGFQFYQEREVGGRAVHHFSLASRLPDVRYRGLQAQFGARLIRRAVARTVPWRSVYLAGVTNSPKSYANMHAVGGKCYPDVLAPTRSNPFGGWYLKVAERLGLASVDHKGLLRDRMQGLGFSMQGQAGSFSDHPIGRSYADYVEHDLRHGIFTLIEVVPGRDIPVYLLKRVLQRLGTAH